MRKQFLFCLIFPFLALAKDDPNYEELPPNPFDPDTYIQHKYLSTDPDYAKWAYTGITKDDAAQEKSYKQFDTNLIPKADSGIKVIQKQIIPGQDSKAVLKELETKGYVEAYTPFPKRNWVVIEKNVDLVELDEKYNKPRAGELDTTTKRTDGEIKLAFPFKPVPNVDRKNVKGFVGSGTYLNDDKGWSGIVEFFIDADLGFCEYSVNNISLVHGGVVVQKDFARHDINDYPNTIYITGRQDCGFEFNINWFNSDYRKNLKCSTLTFNKNKTQKLIQIAKNIEKSEKAVIN